ncbi:alkaline phosphatase family protein [Microbacterium marinilacus]|uniref:Alkaline phosphatase family protein n=1 Tax=Microbacterium marinilacus TaxID=415209 RepID=A0ABP7BJ52_9MICO|nr:nucleotide pyrophosphatase/phosphodiesterase family protein [Microbacterium marinilacus]MBY0688444.1 alkaline phosphatase family protein [Microbacterium marinilacus]
MPPIVPTGPLSARSLTGVAPDILASLSGSAEMLAPVRSAVLIVIDGLGAMQLRAHAGHARRLAALGGKKDVARSVFPSTTAAALTSILTGSEPGQHGLVGYRVMDPARGRPVNQLNGYERDGLDPASWQRRPTVFERAAAEGRRTFAVGLGQYSKSGLTAAILRGAEYVPADDVRARVRLAYELAAAEPGSLVYCYLPEVDQAGHRHGVASDEWVAALEDVDGAFAAPVPHGVGAVATADHGMVDVPRHRHVLLQSEDPRLDGVAHLGGEPRLLHLYLEDDVHAADVARTWERESGRSADVVTRDDAIAGGVFGPVADDVVPRIGDVLVAARGSWAFYDDRLADKRPQDMIGQHGSTTPEEVVVPLLRLGAYAG